MKSLILVLTCLPLVTLAAPQRAGAGRGAAAVNGAGPNNGSTVNAANVANASCDGTARRDGTGRASAGLAACDGMGRQNVGFGQRGRGRGGMNAQNCAGTCIVPVTFVTTLPASKVVAAVEEERLAHDLYALAAEKWGTRVFTHIAGAEMRHAGVLVSMADAAAVTLPVAQPGVYATSEYQTLHASLAPMIGESELGALRAGAFVEETDIADLRRTLAGELDDGTRAVLTNLERGSRQHLRAFVRNLAARGEAYVPKVLSAEDFSAIIGS